ncbi:hypothetical protein BC828DRAFT_302872 [Blastocladiella britannica]|nr:hypothetical protein BC828DRAFT_302872 [Blastocladiella britannica]
MAISTVPAGQRLRICCDSKAAIPGALTQVLRSPTPRAMLRVASNDRRSAVRNVVGGHRVVLSLEWVNAHQADQQLREAILNDEAEVPASTELHRAVAHWADPRCTPHFRGVPIHGDPRRFVRRLLNAQHVADLQRLSRATGPRPRSPCTLLGVPCARRPRSRTTTSDSLFASCRTCSYSETFKRLRPGRHQRGIRCHRDKRDEMAWHWLGWEATQDAVTEARSAIFAMFADEGRLPVPARGAVVHVVDHLLGGENLRRFAARVVLPRDFAQYRAAVAQLFSGRRVRAPARAIGHAVALMHSRLRTMAWGRHIERFKAANEAKELTEDEDARAATGLCLRRRRAQQADI